MTKYQFAVTGGHSRLVYSQWQNRAEADLAAANLLVDWGLTQPGAEPRVLEIAPEPLHPQGEWHLGKAGPEWDPANEGKCRCPSCRGVPDVSETEFVVHWATVPGTDTKCVFHHVAVLEVVSTEQWWWRLSRRMSQSCSIAVEGTATTMSRYG